MLLADLLTNLLTNSTKLGETQRCAAERSFPEVKLSPTAGYEAGFADTTMLELENR